MAARRWFGPREAPLEIIERDGVRYLHLGGSAIQSALRLAAPDRLELPYTRALLGLLLFRPHPRRMLLVGLGGGSIARFVHHHLPSTRLSAVDLDPRMPGVARAHFGLPADDDRLQVQVADGLDHLRANRGLYDCIVLDAFDNNEPAASLSTPDAYLALHDALAAQGVAALNFMANAGQLEGRLPALRAAFQGRILLLLSSDRANLVAYAFRDGPARHSLAALRETAARLAPGLDLELGRTLQALEEMNPTTAGFLHCHPGD